MSTYLLFRQGYRPSKEGAVSASRFYWFDLLNKHLLSTYNVLVTVLGRVALQRDKRYFKIVKLLKNEKQSLGKQLSDFRRWSKVIGGELVRSEHLGEVGTIDLQKSCHLS